MNAKNATPIKDRPKMTPSALMRLAGLSAVAAGLGFVVIGLFHQENVPASVTTTTWVNVHIVATAMGFFGLFGLAGLYARQVEKSGWLGLIGFIMFSIWLALIMGFSFVEAFILPQLANESPAFVAGLLGMFTATASEVDLGVLPTLWNISGPLFIVGPLLFAIATFRAAVLPRLASALLALGAVLVPAGAFLPPRHEPLVMVPIGLAMAWLGYALFSERRETTAEASIAQRTAKPEPSNAA